MTLNPMDIENERQQEVPSSPVGKTWERPGEDRLLPTVNLLLSQQRSDGYWWYTLEANESIGAEFIFLMYFLEAVDEEILRGIARRIRDVQRPDGTWSLYYDGPPDLSTTVECYFALKLASTAIDEPAMVQARHFILAHGGIEATRVFTRIHLALFGIVPWKACPAMPVESILLPQWFPLNIYEFSSWARATVVPLLIVLTMKPVRRLGTEFGLDELFAQATRKRHYRKDVAKGIFSWERGFIQLDRVLKKASGLTLKKFRHLALDKAKEWISTHSEKVEDIYPAMANAAVALKTLGYSLDAPEIQKPFSALKMFQQRYDRDDVPPLPDELRDDGRARLSELRSLGMDLIVQPATVNRRQMRIHQQCCISPVWDTPWSGVALLDAGLAPDHPALIRCARWLLKKQITDVRGDWSIKCPAGLPGGWAFEFENDYFPDVDDTIQVLHLLRRVALPDAEKSQAIKLGLDWCLAMQNDDGGWAAFDRNNKQELVNRIPFSDHGACLDPSSPDITGRMIELLVAMGFGVNDQPVKRALEYLARTQEPFGGWFGRWGINYIYGTWCVATGLASLAQPHLQKMIARGALWLQSIQRADGGWGESPESYNRRTYVPLGASTPSQTAWAVMGLIAAGEVSSPAVQRGVDFLLNARREDSGWDEHHHTGTGFPGHFYIRYHGYRHYFPLLALARYQRALPEDATSTPRGDDNDDE